MSASGGLHGLRFVLRACVGWDESFIVLPKGVVNVVCALSGVFARLRKDAKKGSTDCHGTALPSTSE